MKVEKNDKAYETADLALASFLKTKELNLMGVVKRERGKAVFQFEDIEQRKQLVLDFCNGKGIVDALMYYNNMRNLKSMVFS